MAFKEIRSLANKEYKKALREKRHNALIISQSAQFSYYYARNVLNGHRFKIGEPAIIKDRYWCFRYMNDIVGEFEQGEATIASQLDYAYQYAEQVLGGPFPLGEPAIAQDSEYSYYYARYVLFGRFPRGEAAIARHSLWAYQYAMNIIHGRWIPGEAVIFNSVYQQDYFKMIEMIEGSMDKNWGQYGF